MPTTLSPPLYRWEYEHESCGVGFMVDIHGRRSHQLVERTLTGLKNLAHRGAIDADSVTGDGAGVLTQIPYPLFRKYLRAEGLPVPEDRDLGVGVLFLPQDPALKFQSKAFFEAAIAAEGLTFLVWREVPVDKSCIGKRARATCPCIMQALIKRDAAVSDAAFERRLFLAMKGMNRQVHKAGIKEAYIVSLSARTLTYKGLLNAPQLTQFYNDLNAPDYESAFVLFHQRFATNILPDWSKAQPYRMLAHNGEINTIQGNRNLMRARELSSAPGVWGDRLPDLRPFIQENMSDSASFDEALQLITLAGRSALHSAAMMMPAAWENDPYLDTAIRDFYRYHACLMEPWDGPAAIVFIDGRFVAGALDRNGLRPARYKLYDDDTLIVASEVGIVPEWGAKVVKAGRLAPGKMIAVDLEEKSLLYDEAIKQKLAAQEDYPSWCQRHLKSLVAKSESRPGHCLSEAELLPLRIAFGYDLEEEQYILLPMADEGREPTGSMGDDTPLAVLSQRPRLIYTYFRQRFAQVTNPPIDSVLERPVLSLNMYLGGRMGLFETDKDTASTACYLELDSPILSASEYETLSHVATVKSFSVLFEATSGAQAMAAALEALWQQVQQEGSAGENFLVVLSDRGVDKQKAAIPMLLATGAVHQALIRAGLRQKVDIVCETAEARDVHQIAALLGFGANAVYPYLAFEVIRSLVAQGKTKEGLTQAQAWGHYRQAIEKGLLKIFAKMGISTLFSYQGAQIFEALGVDHTVIEQCFQGTFSPIEGVGYRELAEEVLVRHQRAFAEQGATELGEEGYLHERKRGEGEAHGWSRKVVSGMNKFIRKGSTYEAWQDFKAASDEHSVAGIKDLLQLRYAREAIPLDSVEPIEGIRRHFTTAGMSLGALSPEAHECLAIAMNRIGGKSNSGEGGEDPRRYQPYPNGDNANSAIKQVASGRFGVTAAYLSSAQEIEIKMAQGAKPGEGGQLPGHKVSEMIATLRFSVPGIALISPPPHHDIYSIEDLAQLIFDLKEVNPAAKVCVKLVSSAGVGTIAAGVAKAYADIILISGFEGGTGAAPISSIKYAGSSWEIGIAEAHQILTMNGLRNRVTLRTDGGLKTGLDIIKGAILGAEEYNFGTAALIAAGCSMFRVCHLNKCPVGVATQRDDLRAKFRGKPESVIQYFNAIAEDVRRYLARLGYDRLDAIIGRTALLEQVHDTTLPDKAKTLNLKGLLHEVSTLNRRTCLRNDHPGHARVQDLQILKEAQQTIRNKQPQFKAHYTIDNTCRNIGSRLSGEIARLHGNSGMPSGMLDLTFTGSAGQSFGAFLVQGIRLRLFGEAQDYIGKGMHAGTIIIRPKETEAFQWDENIIVGNTCLYGATGGWLFVAGCAGERFAVRNSRAIAVVEGLGDHGCEYMTGGAVAVLGKTGRNFGAGMSGGLAFVYDPDSRFETCYNPTMVGIERFEKGDEADALQRLIMTHYDLTQSPKAKTILDVWDTAVSLFWRVSPKQATAVTPLFTIADTDDIAAVAYKVERAVS